MNGLTANYNAENQLYSLNATVGGGAETLTYDAVGRRVQKTITGTSGSTSTVYFYDAFGQLAAENVNGAWSRDYIRDGVGNLVATENASGPCTTCYFSYDHLGSVRLVTDQSGLIVARHDYLPYGEEVSGYSGRTMTGFSVAGTAPNDATQKFTGQVRDQESGMDYFNARYLTPVFGRFNSPDPQNAGADLLSSQSWNGYAYVNNNPLALTDPTGQCFWCWFAPLLDVIAALTAQPEIFGFTAAASTTAASTTAVATSLAATAANTALLASSLEGSGGRSDSGAAKSGPLGGPSSAIAYSCDLFGCYFEDQSWFPQIGDCVFAPTGQYNVKNEPNLDKAVRLRFDSRTAWQASKAISVMNDSQVIPTVTDGFRTAMDQLERIKSLTSITPAKVNQSLHQSAEAIDLRVDQNFPTVNAAMTKSGFTWGGTFSTPDPVHYQLGRPGSRPSLSKSSSCGGWLWGR